MHFQTQLKRQDMDKTIECESQSNDLNLNILSNLLNEVLFLMQLIIHILITNTKKSSHV
mgnify:FL=1